jgi:hypothetical protein
MKLMIKAAALGAMLAVGSSAALAFTYENQGTTQPSASQPEAKMGYGEMDPASVLPPVGQSISSGGYDFGPGAFNNGMASQPTRSESVGPSWLYPPR